MGHTTQTEQTWMNKKFLPGSRLILFAFLVIGGFFLITEHTAHLFGVLPYLLLLLCPVMHLFHGGHGGRHGHQQSTTAQSEGEQK